MFRSLVTLALLFALAACSAEESLRADLILTDAHVLTLADSAGPAPTAVAIADGRILYVGDKEGALALSTPETQIEALNGAFVLPGFSDSHCHLYGLGKALAEIDLVGTGSAAEVVALALAEAKNNPQLEWLQGRGWDQNDWTLRQYPHRRLLDAALPDRPVYLRRIDGHAAWVNSEGLRRAGIDRDTPDPEGGAILRDENGDPTGILIDNAAGLVSRTIPRVDEAEIRRRIGLATEHCLRHGITGVHEAGISWRRVQIYREMAAAGELRLRLYGMYDDDDETLTKGFAAGPTHTDDGMLTVRAVKLYADGALGSRGALMQEDYSDDAEHRGLAVTSRERLTDVTRRAAHAGFQVCTHAIGDGGNHLMLDVYEEVLHETVLQDARWRIEHAQILAPNDIPRFAQLGVIAAMQPTHCTSDMDWADERVGPARLAGAYAWRSLLDSGAHLCFGTDFPIERVDPLAGLYSARTRTHQDGTPLGGWQPQEKLDGRTAVELYTAGSAYASFRENELGRIAQGYRADMTVLDIDPIACSDEELLTGQVYMTVVAGQVRYKRDETDVAH